MNEMFFVLDSRNLSKTGTKLYGFSFLDGTLVDRAEQLHGENPEPEGAYIFVRREGDRITVLQDFSGCVGLYLYQERDYWALSDSFQLLTDHVRSEHRLTLNREFADYMLAADLCASVFGETLAKEIRWIDRQAILEIDIPRKQLKIRYPEFQECMVDPGSPEGIALLDGWREKWIRRISGIYENSRNIQEDLSGGFDSRETLMLFLSAEVDLNQILVFSFPDTLHTHKEDYVIATELSRKFGFRLNREENLSQRKDPFTVAETWELSFYSKLGFHNEMYFKDGRFQERKYLFTGNGGECIRDYVSESEETYIGKAVKRCERLYASLPETCKRLQESTRNVLTRTFASLKKHYAESLHSPLTEETISQALYKETRCRNHFGKAILESWLANTVNLSPLMDPDLRKLKPDTTGCSDKSLVAALILGRYIPELAEIPFDSGKSIRAETLAYVRAMSVKYPVPKTWEASSFLKEEETDRAAGIMGVLPDRVPLSMAEAELKKAFLSDKFQKLFEKAYAPQVYDVIAKDIEKRKFHPLKHAYVALGIGKVLQDEEMAGSGGQLLSYVDYLLDAATAASSQESRSEKTHPEGSETGRRKETGETDGSKNEMEVEKKKRNVIEYIRNRLFPGRK